MTQNEENVLRVKLEKLENENAIMRKLSTRKGFYKNYFENLKNSKTEIEAFKKVNKIYHSLFGHYRYNSFSDFRLPNT